jgi:hypothetical protein
VLTPKQEIFCLARAAGATVTESSATAGVAQRTGEYWNRRADILARIDELQALATADALRYLKAHALSAARRLVDLMHPGRTSLIGPTNLAAAKDVLDRVGLKPVEKREQTVIVQRHAEKLAAELGLDVGEVLAEAERIMQASR